MCLPAAAQMKAFTLESHATHIHSQDRNLPSFSAAPITAGYEMKRPASVEFTSERPHKVVCETRPPLHRSPSTYLKNHRCSFPDCDKAYTKPSKLADHERSHTGERPFRCSEPGCEKRFLRKSHLQAHARSHLPKEERPYVCTEPGCVQRFSTNQHLRQHVALHFDPHPYQCDVCNETFKKHFQLKRHKAVVHLGSKPCPCPVSGCNMSFAYQSILDRHVSRAHDETKRYACAFDDCGQQFSKWSSLQSHIKTHHKLTCTYCSKQYADATAFRKHLETHEVPLSERLRYPCLLCDKNFAKIESLKVHDAVVHQGRREHICTICHKSFAHRKTLTSHLLKLHDPSSTTSRDQERAKSRKKAACVDPRSVIEKLTGVGYLDLSASRKFGCIVPECPYRFSREYDLHRHLGSGAHPDLEVSVETLLHVDASTGGTKFGHEKKKVREVAV